MPNVPLPSCPRVLQIAAWLEASEAGGRCCGCVRACAAIRAVLVGDGQFGLAVRAAHGERIYAVGDVLVAALRSLEHVKLLE